MITIQGHTLFTDIKV